MELKNEITQLDKAKLSQEDAEALAEAKPKIDLAKQKFNEDTSKNKLAFITWINETYVPENKRSPIPGEDVTSVNKKFARWYVGKISKHIHPDNFLSAPLAKWKEMEGIA